MQKEYELKRKACEAAAMITKQEAVQEKNDLQEQLKVSWFVLSRPKNQFAHDCMLLLLKSSDPPHAILHAWHANVCLDRQMGCSCCGSHAFECMCEGSSA